MRRLTWVYLITISCCWSVTGCNLKKPVDVPCVQIDFSADLGPATYRASGFLHSISHELPLRELVEPLKPKTFRMSPVSTRPGDTGGAFETCHRIYEMGATLQVLVSDEFGYGGQFGIHPERKDLWPGDGDDWGLWEQCIEKLVDKAKMSGCDVQWDIWNEADIVSFWNPIGDKKARFFDAWKRAWHKIKSLDPQAVIIGPSNAYYDNQAYSYSNGLFAVEEFLEFAKDNNVLPDILSWHVWHEKDIVPEVRRARTFMKAKQINIARISLNEIVHGDHQNDPAMQVWYFADIEQMTVESACRACWPDQNQRSSCWEATLCNLLTYPERKPRAVWWAYKAYADITGELVRIKGTAEISGVAGKDSALHQAHVVLGKKTGEKQSVTVKLTGLDSINGLKGNRGDIRITIQKIPNSGWEVLEKPIWVREEQIHFSKTVDVLLPDFGPSEVYILSMYLSK